jgi:putative hemolysin
MSAEQEPPLTWLCAAGCDLPECRSLSIIRAEIMETIIVEIIIILILLFANGLFSMSELAVVSARKPRLQRRAESGDRRAEAALQLAAEPNDFLATVQIGITLVGILAGAFGGATLAGKLVPVLQQFSALAPYAESLAFGLVVLVITYLSLVIGELVPKRLALGHAEGIARLVAKPMQRLSKISAPVVRLLTTSTDLLLRLFGVRPSGEPVITEDEIRILLRQGAQAGVVEEAERRMVENIFHLGDRYVETLMTPRPDIVWLELNDSPEEIRRKLRASGFSRFPVATGNLDNIVGFVRAKDLLSELLASQQPDLNSVMRRAPFVPESMPVWKVLEEFKGTGVHIAFVVDEHGGTQGLVTHHDILEAIVGDIEPVTNVEDQMIVQRQDGSWLLDGALPVDELRELLKLSRLPGEESGEYHTLGGFVMSQIGRIPHPSDHFEYDGLRFEVLDMDRRRVDKVLVSKVG